jgi:hypothetical protein
MASVSIKRAVIVLLPAILGIGLLFLARRTSLGRTIAWQRQTSPGPLSASHSFLENNCAACHIPMRGPESSQCIACHANNVALLQRQPTSFHARIGRCRDCHFEHRGASRQPTLMDHDALVRIALRPAPPKDRGTAEADRLRAQLASWIDPSSHAGGLAARGNPRLTSREAVLDCSACHGTKDRHSRYFGGYCAECHATTTWTIPEYRHPSPRNTECAQCHQPPPSHTMMHFQVVSAKVAQQPAAKVEQCFLCHQTTAWNDIRGVGYYKHH